nr:MAG TPA: hypothetical protein [Bacteriophage sp.]
MVFGETIPVSICNLESVVSNHSVQQQRLFHQNNLR